MNVHARIPIDLLDRVMKQLDDRKKRLGHRITISAKKGGRAGAIDADRNRIRDLDYFTEILEEARASARER